MIFALKAVFFIFIPKVKEMKSVLSLCIIILAMGVLSCTNETDDNKDMPAYTIGQKCPEHITYDGICDGNKAVFCNDDGIVEAVDCENKCMVKKAYTPPFAECYYECGDIDYKGKCVEDGYDYCNESEGLIHITCDSDKTCGLKGDVYSCI